MSFDPARFWDRAFGEPEYRYGTEPNAFIHEMLPAELPDTRSSILFVGDGEGRNGVWAATQTYAVTCLEPSSVGLAKARALADEMHTTIETIQDAMPSDSIEDASFDAVVLCYVHTPPDLRAEMHAACLAALKPGGVLLLEGFTPDQLRNKRTSGGPGQPEMMFTEDILRADFADGTITHLEATTVTLNEGPGHTGPADVIRCVVRR
jgi:SAM-dependent methyltransferase